MATTTNIERRDMTILRRQEVQARVGLSRSTLYKKVSDGEFPGQIKLGARAVGWIAAEVDDWLSNRVQETRQQQVNVRAGDST